MLTRAKSQLGEPTGTGWMKVNKGVYGFNYLRRSVINMAGLGANVREENASYTTFADGNGSALAGASSRYMLRLQTPPPVNSFWRSEEHTSELQSLMRISYAVFCLKKKKN